jgi:hypothetical protein
LAHIGPWTRFGSFPFAAKIGNLGLINRLPQCAYGRREYEFVSLSEALGEAWSVNESVSEAVREGVNEARQKRRLIAPEREDVRLAIHRALRS